MVLIKGQTKIHHYNTTLKSTPKHVVLLSQSSKGSTKEATSAITHPLLQTDIHAGFELRANYTRVNATSAITHPLLQTDIHAGFELRANYTRENDCNINKCLSRDTNVANCTVA